MPTPKKLRRRRSRFINVQRHKAACGPIAIANVIKWLGIETSYLKLLQFCVQVRAYSKWEGMHPFQMTYVLKTLKIPHRAHRVYTVEDLDALIDSGGAAIVTYQTKGYKGGHAVFINGRNDHGYLSWNHIHRQPPWFTRDDMKRSLIRSMKRKGGLRVYSFKAHTPVKKDTVPKDSST